VIPIEFLWLTVIIVWGFVGSARGLAKELGASAVLMLSLFSLYMAWHLVLSKLVGPVGGKGGIFTGATIQAVYYGIATVIVAYISYQGIVLSFPIREVGGVWGVGFGYLGGLLNGYLIIGTIWNVMAKANYFSPKVSLVSCCFSKLNNTLVEWLPISLMVHTTPWIFLGIGMLLLLLIILK
jgi:hypothetical protein